MKPIVLKDGTYIYDTDGFIQYLLSLGFDKIDLQQINLEFHPEELNPDEWVRRDDIDDYEYMYSEVSNEIRYARENIYELCNKLASGKGGTKKQYAERLIKAFEENISI